MQVRLAGMRPMGGCLIHLAACIAALESRIVKLTKNKRTSASKGAN